LHWHNISLRGYLDDQPPAEFEARFYATQQGEKALASFKRQSPHQTQRDTLGELSLEP
jgi:hypothetical protein